jgi:hypothetical protein
LIEEENEPSDKKSPRVKLLSPIHNIDSKDSQAKSISHVIPHNFRNYKRTTTLDEYYVQNNHFIRNDKNPYENDPINFDSESLVIEVKGLRFLPDTVNFVKAKGMVYGVGGNTITKVTTELMRLSGDINNVIFDYMIILKDMNKMSYDDAYFIIIWETFEDVFGEDDIEFLPLVFGFSVLKLFQAKGKKSLES